MRQKKSNTVKERQKYSSQFKERAIERAQREGVPKTASDLGIHEAMLYSWRKKYESTGVPVEDHKIQMADLARLKRDLPARLFDCVALSLVGRLLWYQPKLSSFI